jgi:hypothetical protein
VISLAFDSGALYSRTRHRFTDEYAASGAPLPSLLRSKAAEDVLAAAAKAGIATITR